ncbi:MAG: distantly related to 4-amino-4-deoxy-L-arabinotransferase [Phycisphaerales bacterium]|nr:distantly related to 4-amino-4-deoxy-L-arabinotransferase [Phycisphaerales bacterium]
MRWLLVLVITGPLCVYMVGNGATGLFDRDEPRYAQTSRQMLASGDWVVPHFLDKIRTAKPVLIYWCQASAMAVLGDNRFAARLPSSLAMAATVAMLAIGVSRATGRRRGLWCAFILSSCGMAIISAKMCLTDGVLLLLITTSQLCLYRLWRRGPDSATIVLLGLSAGLAGLTKGPVALGINGTTIVVLWLLSRSVSDRKWQSPWRAEHFPMVIGVAGAVLIATVFPWLYAIQARAPQFLSTAIGHDVIDRIQRGQEGHTQPPGFYSLIVWATFFPWSLLIPAALVWGWKRRHIAATRFALAALVGPWVMFELIATKLPHYVLPTYPALAYLVADLLVLASRGKVKDLSTRGFRGMAWVWGIGVSLIGVAAPVALLVSGQAHTWLAVGALWIAAVAIATGISTAMRFSADRPLAAARAMGGGTLLVIAIAYVMVLPNIPTLRLTRDIAQLFIDNDGYGKAGYMIDFKEPSLAFEQGGGLREQSDNDYLNTTPPSAWPEWIVTTRPVWDATRADVRAQWTEIGSVSGVAYSDGGKRHEVLVLRKPHSEGGQ